MPRSDPDNVASHLRYFGRMAADMPPAWAGHCIRHPVCGPAGQPIGWMLPGRGLLLSHDLKDVGIDRGGDIPFVIERSPIERLADGLARARNATHRLLEDERGAITTYDGIIAARAGGNAEDRMFAKTSFTTVANTWSSLWQAGGFPAAGAYTSTPGSAPNNATTGALSFALSTPGSGKKYLLGLGYMSGTALNALLLTDLLSQVGSLNAASSSNQVIASQALTRYTTGAGVLMTFDVSSAIGTTASNLTITYTNQAGTGSQATPAVAMTVSMIAQRLLPAALGPFMQLASGDTGVRQVTNVKLSAAMTTGTFALNLYYPLLLCPGLPANVFVERNSTEEIDALAELVIGSDSVIGCLNAYVFANTTTSGLVNGFVRTCSG